MLLLLLGLLFYSLHCVCLGAFPSHSLLHLQSQPASSVFHHIASLARRKRHARQDRRDMDSFPKRCVSSPVEMRFTEKLINCLLPFFTCFFFSLTLFSHPSFCSPYSMCALTLSGLLCENFHPFLSSLISSSSHYLNHHLLSLLPVSSRFLSFRSALNCNWPLGVGCDERASLVSAA